MKNLKNREKLVNNENLDVNGAAEAVASVEQETEKGLLDLSDLQTAAGRTTRIRNDVAYAFSEMVVKNGSKAIQNLTPQAKALVLIINDCMTKTKKFVTERELAIALYAAQKTGRLSTTQDAWRIFQYYRPRLLGLYDPERRSAILVKVPVTLQ